MVPKGKQATVTVFHGGGIEGVRGWDKGEGEKKLFVLRKGNRVFGEEA
jgi:hypothetical protein